VSTERNSGEGRGVGVSREWWQGGEFQGSEPGMGQPAAQLVLVVCCESSNILNFSSGRLPGRKLTEGAPPRGYFAHNRWKRKHLTILESRE